MAKETPVGRGKVVRRNVNGRAQIAKHRNRAITAEEKAAFLGHLSGCCNVTASAVAAGRTHDGFYRIRNRDPEFAAQWQGALEAGHATIEALMLERARMALEAEKHDGEAGSAARQQGTAFALSMDSDQILRLLAFHRRSVNGDRRVGKSVGPAASEEEATAAILKKLALLRKRLDAKNAKKA
jgi:hypothetical protein